MMINDVQKQFGEKIRDCRKRKGMSQETLSELVDKTLDTISNIERGYTSTRIKTAIRLAKALDVPLVELFDFQATSQEDRQRRNQIQKVVEILRSCDDKTLNGAVEILKTHVRVCSSESSPNEPP